MKKRLFCCAIVFLLLVAGCAELPTASYADGSPESSCLLYTSIRENTL